MITDRQINTVYFSSQTQGESPQEFEELVNIIESEGYHVGLIAEADDFYCRDFMPVQIVKNDFVQFIFRPASYLNRSDYRFISNPVYIELFNNFKQPRYSPIILDGGNIIKWKDKVVITRRVIKDNLYQFPSEEAIVYRLEYDLKCQVLLIDEYPEESTGHADGLIRFIDSDTVFINQPNPKFQDWEDKFRIDLKNYGLKFIELPCPMDENMKTADGLYINYLQVGELIIVPQFGINKTDGLALETIKKNVSADMKVKSVNASWIAKYGGVLNCSSWGILK
ncbi:agmatine deiminase family protein [uncultured Draconibacterium sp.]|uniref:agmatine deiminase family protein n=1 Tax=uncultured Draconibacterium sp. TaxID=1573823 RepID=UPI0025FCF89E|nr:agmatine deiminase family protein [uncultured Draconibacterium sp.]